MGIKDKWNQLVYAFSTEDRYAGYEDHNHNHNHNGQIERPAETSNSKANAIQLGEYSDGDGQNEVQHSTEGVSETILGWRHIDDWTAENHHDLNASLSDPCTRTDIMRAEEDLGISFPPPVRASFRIHDGQEDMESLTGINGLFFGLRLMGLDEVVQMTKTWRVVAERMNLDEEVKKNKAATASLISPIGSSAELDQEQASTPTLTETEPGYKKVDAIDYKNIDPDLQRKISTTKSKNFKSHIPRQRSMPPGFVKPVYANAGWIPLATDDSGNNVGVDLAPDSEGSWGQVIVFGREFDTKFVVAKNWGEFLLNFAKDLENGNYILHEEEDLFAGDGDLGFFDKRIRREVPYLQGLTKRVLDVYFADQHNNNHHLKAEEPKSALESDSISHILPKASSSKPEKFVPPASSEGKSTNITTSVKSDTHDENNDDDIDEHTKDSIVVETAAKPEPKEPEDLIDRDDSNQITEIGTKEDKTEETQIAEKKKDTPKTLVNEFENVSLN